MPNGDAETPFDAPQRRAKLRPTRRAVVGALCVVAALKLGWELSPWGTLGYIEERTGLDLPTFPSQLEVENDFEMSVSVRLVLPRDRVVAMLATPRFRAGDQDRGSPAPRAQLHRAHGCRGKTTWSAVLDESSGALSVSVQYPDRGGDAPVCPLRGAP
ncbi:MAG: hypothetical protein R3A52_02200 [Polyangiales bacterium]